MPELVGREWELGVLRHALEQRPAVVLLEGEAGIGKSRLVREVLGASSGTLVAACPPLREPFTLGPLVDALRPATDGLRRLRLSALAGTLRPLFPEWAADLPPAPEPIGDPTAARHRLFRAVAELLEALSIDLLVVEDVHWADDTTLELLLFLLSRPAPGPSLLVSYRPEEVPPESILYRLTSRLPTGTTPLRITLEALDLTGTTGLVSSMLQGEQVSLAFAEFLHRRTDGLPLAIEETIRLMHDRADLTRRSGEWVRRQLTAIDVPPTVRDSVLERTGRLGPDAQTVLRAAAVLTDPADETLLTEISGLPPARAIAGIDEALGSRLLQEHEHGQLGFRHVLAGRAIYGSVPGRARAALHRRAGEVLERHGTVPAARLARHFRVARQTAQWCRYAEQAADLALESGAVAEAVTLLHDVVVSARIDAATMVRFMNKVPGATPQAYRRMVDALQAALATEDSAAIRAEIRFELGYAFTKMQEYESGRTALADAIPDLGHDPFRLVRALVLLGWPFDDACPASDHLDWLQRAADVRPPVGSPERVRLDLDRCTALLLLGDESGWSVAADMPAVGDTPQIHRYVATAQVNVGYLALVWGRYPEAERRLATVAGLDRTGDLGMLAAMAAVNSAHLDFLTGRWDGLADRADDLAADESLGPMSRFEAQLIREMLRHATEPTAPDDDGLVAVRAGALDHGAVPELMEPAAALARARLDAGRVEDAVEVTAEPFDIVTRKGTWIWASDLATVRTEALLAAGRAEEAAALVESFAEGIRGLDAPALQTSLLLCRALVSGSASDFATAADALELLPRPYDALLARERQAGCLLDERRTAEATELLSSVLADLTGLGARRAAARVAGSLRQLGVRSTWRGGTRGYGDELSPRELDVARLLVGGRTNREIAQALYLSPKTIARHLNSAMRKLDVTSRTALAVRVVELGLVSAATH